MNSLRIARVALRARPAAIKAPLGRRGYAEAVSDKVGTISTDFAAMLTHSQIKLSLALPHQVCYNRLDEKARSSVYAHTMGNGWNVQDTLDEHGTEKVN